MPFHTLVERDNHGSEDGMEGYWQDDGAMNSPFDEPQSEWPSGTAISQSTVRASSIFTFVACVAMYAQMVLSACDGGVCPWQGHLEIQPWD